MLAVDAKTFELPDVLAHYAEHGYARLGRVLDAHGLELLRERADDLMLGRVSYPGFFWQMDAPTGRYEDAPLGLGWQGPSLDYRKLEKLEKDGEVGKDDVTGAEKRLDALTKKHVDAIDDLLKHKEGELLEV